MIPLIIIVYAIVFLLGVSGIYFLQGKTALGQAFRVPDSLLQIIILGLGCSALVIVLSIIGGRWFRFIRILEEEFRVILGRLSYLEIITIALASGMAEETLFRGAIQPLLGLTATSLIFGILHFPRNRRYLAWTIFAMGMGFLLGWLYQYTETLLTPMITHFVVNLGNLWRISRLPENLA